MNRPKQKRNRGLVLTDQGWSRFQTRKQEWENKDAACGKYTIEELCELSGLTYTTVSKIIKRRQGVDRRTLVKFLMAFDLELIASDYVLAASVKQLPPQDIAKKVDWDQQVELPFFFGRETELTTLEKWTIHERCRLICVRGLGGIGKTALCVKLVEKVEQQFDFVIWRSLKNPLSLKDLLLDLHRVMSIPIQSNNNGVALNTRGLIRQLSARLRSHRCLLVLDSLENIMQGGVICGKFLQQYQDYSYLIEYIGEVAHQSCLLLLTREQPKTVSLRQGKKLPIRSLELLGLRQQDAQQIIARFSLTGTLAEQSKLLFFLSFHPFNTITIAQEIEKFHSGNISLFSNKNAVYNDRICQLITQQIERLSSIETKVLYILSASNQPKSFSELKQSISKTVSLGTIIESLESLVERSLVIRKLSKFAVQSIIARYTLFTTKKTLNISPDR